MPIRPAKVNFTRMQSIPIFVFLFISVPEVSALRDVWLVFDWHLFGLFTFSCQFGSDASFKNNSIISLTRSCFLYIALIIKDFISRPYFSEIYTRCIWLIVVLVVSLIWCNLVCDHKCAYVSQKCDMFWWYDLKQDCKSVTQKNSVDLFFYTLLLFMPI